MILLAFFIKYDKIIPMKIVYVTGNMQKVADARARLDRHGMSVEQQKVNTLEIQSDSIAEIARHKAQQAYEIIGKPLVVNDAGWIIPALKGFPGPYMRYINEWLTASDLLALMKDKSDRSIVLKEVLAYHDGKKISVFEKDTFGTIVESPRGGGGQESDKVVCLDVASGKTIAEQLDEDVGSDPIDQDTVWDIFVKAMKV